MTAPDQAPTTTARRRLDPLGVSLLALGAMLLFIEIGLATEPNWPKMLRVGAAVSGYAVTLFVLGTRRHPESLWRYCAAGFVAGLLSGVVRSTTNFALIASSALLAALLLGPMHWVIVRRTARASSPLRNHDDKARQAAQARD